MTLAVLLIFLTFVFVSCTDFCAEELKCKEEENSGCDCDFGSECKNPNEYEPSDDIRYEYVKMHNNYREKVASGEETRGEMNGAVMMYALQYDPDLEYVANCHNKKCIYAGDKCRMTKTFPQAGQNRYYSEGTSCDWIKCMEDAVEKWYEELQNITLGCLRSFTWDCRSMDVDHFTQLVWAETTHVGCSLVQYICTTGECTGSTICQIVCNYGPRGNTLGSSVFMSGTPGVLCDFKSKNFEHLCLLTKDQENVAGEQKCNGKFIISLALIYVLLK